jgi:hypothetical protein
MAEPEVAPEDQTATGGHAHIRRAHSDTELLEEHHDGLSPLSSGNISSEALGSGAFLSEAAEDDGNGLDKLDFTDQFGGHFLERLTDLWTRYEAVTVQLFTLPSLAANSTTSTYHHLGHIFHDKLISTR